MKCKNCGAELNPASAVDRVAACPVCATPNILYKDTTKPDIVELMEQGKELLNQYKFDEALAVFQSATKKASLESETHWYAALADLHVGFKKDATGAFVPVRYGEMKGKMAAHTEYRMATVWGTPAMKQEYARLAQQIDALTAYEPVPAAGPAPAPAYTAPAPEPAPAPAYTAPAPEPAPAPAYTAPAPNPYAEPAPNPFAAAAEPAPNPFAAAAEPAPNPFAAAAEPAPNPFAAAAEPAPNPFAAAAEPAPNPFATAADPAPNPFAAAAEPAPAPEVPAEPAPAFSEAAPIPEAPAPEAAAEPAPAPEAPAEGIPTEIPQEVQQVEEIPMDAPPPPPMGAPGQPPMGAPGFGAPGQPPMGAPGFGAPGQPPMGAPGEVPPAEGAPQAGAETPKECEIVNGELVKYTGTLNRVVIPVSVTSIKENAFENSKMLSNVVIPNSVTKIGARAFAHCNSLRVVFIPESVTSMGKEVFLGCNEFLTINCSAPKAPKSWEKNWDKKGSGMFGGHYKAIWGYKG